MKINVTNLNGKYVAEVHGRPELYGEGSAPSVALRELAKVVEYMGEDITPGTELTASEKRAVAAGNAQIASISLHRRTGIDFSEADRIVDKFIDDERVKRLNERDLPQLDAEEIEMVRSNRLLMAVKHVKERLNLGLKESKEAVDKFRLCDLHDTSGSAEVRNRGGYGG